MALQHCRLARDGFAARLAFSREVALGRAGVPVVAVDPAIERAGVWHLEQLGGRPCGAGSVRGGAGGQQRGVSFLTARDSIGHVSLASVPYLEDGAMLRSLTRGAHTVLL